MNRRQFLRNAAVTGAVAAVCPTALKIAERFTFRKGDLAVFETAKASINLDRSGTITGRVRGVPNYSYQNREWGTVIDCEGRTTAEMMYGRGMGKSRAADIYKYCIANPQAKVLRVTQQKNAVIQMGNANFAELEARVMAAMSQQAKKSIDALVKKTLYGTV